MPSRLSGERLAAGGDPHVTHAACHASADTPYDIRKRRVRHVQESHTGL